MALADDLQSLLLGKTIIVTVKYLLSHIIMAIDPPVVFHKSSF